MSAGLWPCWKCGMSGVKNLGTRGYCAEHLAELLGTFTTLSVGVGLHRGGPVVECSACGATWHGVPGEQCGYCLVANAARDARQRVLLLTVPDRLPVDTFEQRARAWGERLRRGVAVGLVDEAEAQRVWRRAVARAAA